MMIMTRSYFKISPQAQSLRWIEVAILEIAYYYCGCPPRSALILDLIEGFEIASKHKMGLLLRLKRGGIVNHLPEWT